MTKNKIKLINTLFVVAILFFVLLFIVVTFHTPDNPSDVNGDGTVDMKDLSIVAYYLDDIEYEE